MENQEPRIRVRINQIDSVVLPTGALDNTGLGRAPVIRIYGDSSIGKKTCLYVHQVCPYTFVEYAGKLEPERGELPLSSVGAQYLELTTGNDMYSEPTYWEVDALAEPRHSDLYETQP